MALEAFGLILFIATGHALALGVAFTLRPRR